VGMGNPMLPTSEESGTEPLVAAKCKKDKKKCKKIKEGLLDNIDDTIDNLDNNDLAVLNFIDYLIANKNTKYMKWADEELKQFYLQKISSDKKGTIIIDYTNNNFWEASALSYIPITKDMPVNNIKFINCGKDTIIVKPFIADISKFNIEIYKDNNNKIISGRLTISCESLRSAPIKLCTFKCDEVKLFGSSIQQVEINKNTASSDCNTFELDYCPNLEEIKGSILNIANIVLPANYVKKCLCNAGIISNSSRLSINKGVLGISNI
jgi:hypothetical protein